MSGLLSESGVAGLQASPPLLYGLNGSVLSKNLAFGVGSPLAGVSYLLAFRAALRRASGVIGWFRQAKGDFRYPASEPPHH
jgi:hypothetical protein